jgi:hypothetical protein
MPLCYTRSIGDKMIYVIFEIKSEDIGKIEKEFLHHPGEYDPESGEYIETDESRASQIVSRQSILIRDSRALDLKGDFCYIKIDGSEEGLKKAEELAKKLGFKKLDKKKAEKINKKIEEQEDSAATGMGMIFD